MRTRTDRGSALVGLALLILFVVFFPFLGIWVINTLFDTNNPYDFWHWLAMVVAILFFGAGNASSSSSKK